MFRSRQTIALSIIALYFIPILFLSVKSMSVSSLNQTWSLFSLGLGFGIAGSLILILLMIRFEESLSQGTDNQEGSVNSFDEDRSHLNLDAIINNLNEELDLKNREIQELIKTNLKLKTSLKEPEMQAQRPTPPLESKSCEAQKEQLLQPEPKIAETPIKLKNTFETIQNAALDIAQIEQSLYKRDNKVEVTRL